MNKLHLVQKIEENAKIENSLESYVNGLSDQWSDRLIISMGKTAVVYNRLFTAQCFTQV